MNSKNTVNLPDKNSETESDTPQLITQAELGLLFIEDVLLLVIAEEGD